MSLDLDSQNTEDTPEFSLTAHLNGREKAAIAVRLLLQSGAVPALADLPEKLQAELTLQLVRMVPVEQITVDAVAIEFADAIEAIGLSFPDGLESALGLLDGVPIACLDELLGLSDRIVLASIRTEAKTEC